MMYSVLVMRVTYTTARIDTDHRTGRGDVDAR